MMILTAVVLFVIGLVLIIKGADVFIDAASWMADVTGISGAVIGATIVSFATTSPEYFVSTIAVLKGFNDLSIGNAVGSVICNIGIAFAALAIFTPGKIHDRLFGAKGLIMFVSTATLLLFCLNGIVSSIEGIILLFIFVFFTLFNIRFSKEDVKKTHEQTNSREIAINIAKFVGGASAVVFGANIIVDNGKIIATLLGVPEAIIGLTIVAIGTSLPEIVTSITAIIKNQNAISIGNIIGANILDATLILATGAFVSSGGLAVSQPTIRVDLPFALAIMVMTVLPTAIGKKIYRWQGIMIFATYVGYLLYITVC